MGIDANLKATGVADVIVILEPDAAIPAAALGSEVPAAIAQHFKASPYSQDAALLETLQARTFVRRLDSEDLAVSEAYGLARQAPVGSRYYPNLGVALGSVDRPALAALRREPAVQKVVMAPQLRLIRPVATAATAAMPGYTWGLRALGIDGLHDQGLTGRGVRIGHLDTGIDASHPALADVLHDYAEFDLLGNRAVGASPRDSAEHGTHTAGTLAAQPIDGIRFGVAPGARLVSAMVIEHGNVLARILGGMNWMVGQNVRVLSMSLGLVGVEDTFLAISQILRARGVLPVFAVGNDGPGRSRYPGNYAEALSVGAADSNSQVPDFSSSQLFKRAQDAIVPDLVGPGVDVVSCVPGGGYKQMSGTSMATPHIAGLAALLMEAKPDASIDAIEAAIFGSCALPPDMLASRANRGFPNAAKALSLL